MATIEIAIGPVQDFVARSRRTRDLWASSFLLSYLTAQAVQGLREAGAEIVRPVVKGSPLMDWVAGRRLGSAPTMGGLPNQIQAKAERDPFEAVRRAQEAFEAAWNRIAEAVWSRISEAVRRLVEKGLVDHGDGVRERWDRQVANYWEFVWVVGEAERLLGRRKQFRTRLLPDEPGDKCVLFHDLQELSGFDGATREGRAKQETFWREIRRICGEHEIRKTERLSAIGLIKRLFPLVGKEELGEAWADELRRWPSTLHLALVPWIENAEGQAWDELDRYAEEVKKGAKRAIRRPVRLRAFEGTKAAEVEPNLLFRHALRNQEVAEEFSLEEEDLRRFEEILLRIERLPAKDGRPLGPPVPYFGLLMADGDRLGQAIASIGAESVSGALLDFSRNVPGVVEQYAGVTVYSGGDDVLAMLPADRAIECAESLAKRFEESFRCYGARASLSAGVVLAHVREPLSAVLREARWLLDEVAKEKNGRGSLAVSVFRGRGRNVLFASRWKRKGNDYDLWAALDRLRQLLLLGDGGASTSLVHRLKQTLSPLCGWSNWQPGIWGRPQVDDLRGFVLAEVRESELVADDEKGGRAVAESIVQLLPRARQGEETGEVGVDGLVLAAFLARLAKREVVE